jgi:hypothetical protein
VLASSDSVAARQAVSIATSMSAGAVGAGAVGAGAGGAGAGGAGLLVTHSLKDYVDVATRLATRLGGRPLSSLVSAHLSAVCGARCAALPLLARESTRLPPPSTRLLPCACQLLRRSWARDLERGAAAAFEVKRAAIELAGLKLGAGASRSVRVVNFTFAAPHIVIPR